MPRIGIIAGRGESQESLEEILKLIKALRKRFDSDIKTAQIEAGCYELYGFELTSDAKEELRNYNAIFSGDFSGYDGRIGYTITDILLELSTDLDYTYIQGSRSFGTVDVRIASYFDGGCHNRDGKSDWDGRTETRVCSAYTAKNIVSYIVRSTWKERRMKIVFVKDSEYEFIDDMFYAFFKSSVLPIENFQLSIMTTAQVCEAALKNPSQFDTVFASPTTAQALQGIYAHIMGDDFASYHRYGRVKPLYYVKSPGESGRQNNIPSLMSHIAALAGMLEMEFGMLKEAYWLRNAVSLALDRGFSSKNADEFVDAIIEELAKKMRTKLMTNKPKRPNILR